MATTSVAVTDRTDSRCEYIDSRELAVRWCLPESWVRERVRSRSEDPLPHVKFGKYVRFRWNSEELQEWAQKRVVASRRNDRHGRNPRKDSVQ